MLSNRYEGITRPRNDYEAYTKLVIHYEYLSRNKARYEARNAAVYRPLSRDGLLQERKSQRRNNLPRLQGVKGAGCEVFLTGPHRPHPVACAHAAALCLPCAGGGTAHAGGVSQIGECRDGKQLKWLQRCSHPQWWHRPRRWHHSFIGSVCIGHEVCSTAGGAWWGTCRVALAPWAVGGSVWWGEIPLKRSIHTLSLQNATFRETRDHV